MKFFRNIYSKFVSNNQVFRLSTLRENKNESTRRLHIAYLRPFCLCLSHHKAVDSVWVVAGEQAQSD